VKLATWTRHPEHWIPALLSAATVFLSLGLWWVENGELNSMRTDQRAYLTVDRIALASTTESPPRVGARVLLSNKGKTPARNVSLAGTAVTFGRVGYPDKSPEHAQQLACFHWLEVCRAKDAHSDPSSLGVCERFGAEDMDSDLTCRHRK
jgi:hypothetical protein